MALREDTPFHAVELTCTADVVSCDELYRSSENCHAKASFFGGDETLFLSHSTYKRPFMKKQFTKAFLRGDIEGDYWYSFKYEGFSIYNGFLHLLKLLSRLEGQEIYTWKRPVLTGKFPKQFSFDALVAVWLVLRICYQLVDEGKQATQRELFYRLLSEAPNYFNCQQQVNDTIQDVVAVLKCSRSSLGILASSKGSVIGRLIIQESNGDLVDCTNMGTTGQVISGDLKCIQSWRFQSDARYILLVEKDAIFQRLQEDKFFHSFPCIIITAKGYPDLASRVFLHQLRCVFPRLPIVAIVDWNPAGLAIICTYKFGSIRMGLEASSYVCDVKWLGLRSKDLQLIPKESFLPLTAKDRQLGASLLSSKMLQGKEQYKQELACMLEFGQRIEIEALYAHGYNFLGKYIAQKIMQRDYI